MIIQNAKLGMCRSSNLTKIAKAIIHIPFEKSV